MKLLPVALNLASKNCLVVGGGAVAARKVGSLLECEAHVRVVAPQICGGMAQYTSRIQLHERRFEVGDLDECDLVFACTGDEDVNREVSVQATSRRIWCNVTDDATLSDIHLAAAVWRGEICIGVTTGGGSPALARHLKGKVAEAIGDEYETLLEMMSERREELKKRFPEQAMRAEIWKRILESGALEALRGRDRAEAVRIVEGLVEGG